MDARRPAAHPRGRTLPSILLLGLAVTLAACGSAGASPSAAPPSAATTAAPTRRRARAPSPVAAFPVTLTDDEGTSVTIPAEPEQIVTLTNAATETMFALGLGDRVVGKVEDFTVYPPEAAAVPDVAKFGSVDVEQIVAAGTDLVIAGGSNFNPPESIAQAAPAGHPHRRDLRRGHAAVLADIELMGAAVGRPEEAAAIQADDPGRDRRGHGRDRGPRGAAGVLRARRDATATSARRPTTSAPR